MASNFLKHKAEEQAKKIDKEYGKGTYGSTADLKRKTEEAQKSSSTKSALSILEQLAEEREKRFPGYKKDADAFDNSKFLLENNNAYTSAKSKANTKTTNTKTTITSNLTDEERKARIKEIEEEIVQLNADIDGLGRASAFVGAKDRDYYETEEEKARKKIEDLSDEKKTLERVGTFTASELKQFEIDDAKAKKAALAPYNPVARVDLTQIDSYKENIAAHAALDEEIDELERQKAEYKRLEKLDELNAYTTKITSKNDYEQNSKYSPLKPKTDKELKAEGYKLDAEGKWYKEWGLGFREGYTGEDSDIYTYINDPSQRLSLEVDAELVSGINTYEISGYHTLTDEEKGAFNYLYHQDRQNGTNTAEEYLKNIGPLLEYRAMELEAKRYGEISKEAPVLMSGISLGTNLANALMFPAKVVATATGTYEDMPSLDIYGNRTQAIRGAVSEDMPYLGRLAYNGVMSIGDMGVAMAAGGGNSKLIQAIMSSSAGSSTISNAKNNGASDGKALVLGLGSAAIEWATERYSVEAILKNPETILGYITTNVVTESAEEGVANVSNMALDAIVSKLFGERNEIQQRVDYLVLYEGKTEEEALIIATNEKLQSLGEDVLVGGLTGFGMSSLAASPTIVQKGIEGINNKSNKNTPEQPVEEPDTLYKAAMDVVEARDKAKVEARREETEPLDFIIDDGLPIREETKFKTENKPLFEERQNIYERNNTNTPIYERLEALSQNNESITADEVKKATGFGEEGSKLVSELVNNEGVTFDRAVRTVKTAYLAGFADVESAKVNFETDTQINAFTAGKKDRVMQDFAEKKNAKNVVINKQSGFSAENLPGDVTKSQVEIVNQIAEAVGVRAYIEKGLKGNAELNRATGEVPIDFDFEREIGTDENRQKVSIVFHAAHEMALHRVVELSPEEGSAFVYAMYNHLAGNDSSSSTLADQKRNAYAGQGIDISLAEAMEEVSANNILYLYGNNEAKFQKAIDNIVNGKDVKAKQGLRKYLDYLKEIIKKISNLLSGKKGKARTEIQSELDEVTKLRDMFETAFAKAVEKRKAIQTKSSENLENKTNKEYNENISYSLRNKRTGKGKRTYYNEYQTNAMLWARSTGRKAGDTTILNANGKYFALIEATEDGFIELRKGSYKEVQSYYERAYRKAIDEVYGNIEGIKAEQGRDIWDLQYAGYGRNDDRDGGQIGSEELQDDSTRSDEHLRFGDKGKSTDVDEKIKYSLKEEYWHTDLSKAQIKEVEGWLRKKGNPEETKITDTAYWYKGRIAGKDLFVIYSTEDVDNPTILYEIKGENASFELDVLIDLLEDKENGKSINGKPSFTQRLSEGNWLQDVNSSQNNIRRMGSGGNNQNAGVLQRQSKRNGSPAFRNVIENLFREQEKDGSLNDRKSYSLKDSLQTKIKYSPTGIKLSAKEYAKFYQSTSTDYYKSYKTHEGLQYQSCVTDAAHILYIYEDGGFGKYNVVARIDYKYDDVAKTVMEVLNNEEHYKITGVVNEILETYEVRRGGYTIYNTRTKRRSSSRGDGTLLKGTSKSHAGGTDGSSSRFSGNKRGTGDGESTDGGLNERKSYSLKETNDINYKDRKEQSGNVNSSENLEIKTNDGYNGNISYELQDTRENVSIERIKKLILSINGRRGLKYDGGKIIRIPNNDVETLRHKFMTEHYYSNRSGGIIDCIDCFGQGGEKLYFYIFYVGEDNRVAPFFRLDYEYIERYIDDVRKISNEMGYNKDEFIIATSGNGKGIDRIRNLAKSDSIYDVPNARERTDYKSGERHNYESGGRTKDNRRNDSGIPNGHNEQSDNGKSTTRNGKEKHSLKGTVVEGELASLVNKYGAIPKGENPARDIEVPKKTEKNKIVSQTVRTILEAKATPDEVLPTIAELVTKGEFSYDVYTDKEAISKAEESIAKKGWETAKADWYKSVGSGEVSKKNTAEGWVIYNNAVNSGDVETALEVLNFMIQHQRSAAQALQATRILKKLSPETQLYAVQRSVQSLQEELTDRYGDKAPDLKIDEGLAEQFINAETAEERAELEKEIYKDIGRQMPSRFIDKWNAWRYLSMLGNVRTHVRNIVGNAGFAPVVLAKNLTATAIESVVHRVSGKKTLRGKSIVWGSKADRALLKAAWGDYGNVADLISNGGKYSDFAMANKHIEEGRQIFKFKTLEWARKGNSKLLDTEDMWFSKPHYAYALAQYCKANNITAEQIERGKAIGPARDYAIKEAQKATYRDTNAFSQMVSEWGRSNKNEKNVVKKAFNTAVEGTLPFRKTPANILVRGVEYSPLGLIKGLSYDLYQVSKGKMSASEAIDNISAGLTGTGLLALGVFLAAQGLIRGHGEDEEEKEFKELMGHQSYALELPGGESITLDWLAPEALPFFVGVNLWETTKGADKEVNFQAILEAVSTISEPMLEMSCLQSLNELFEGIGYASSNDLSHLVSILSSAVTSYLTQGIPTLLGQAERTGEENRMEIHIENNDFLTGGMQYTLGRISAKIPFWEYNQIPYIDAWGRKEATGTALKRGFNNFLNPAYTSTVETSDMEEELLRLYEKTGDGGVFPTRAEKYFTIDGERKDLTADEYVRYATLKGEKSYKLVSDLVKSKAYKKLSDEEKAKAISESYKYADQKAQQAISKYEPDKWVLNADKFGANIGNYIAFKTEVSGTKEDNGGKISKQEIVDIIIDVAKNDSEIWKMYLSEYENEEALKAQEIGIDAETYIKADTVLYDIKADYIYQGRRVDGKDLTADEKENAKLVKNSRRDKIERYLNSVCDTEKEYLFLLGTEYDSIKDDYDYVKYFGK